jgi:hypothetical protein
MRYVNELEPNDIIQINNAHLFSFELPLELGKQDLTSNILLAIGRIVNQHGYYNRVAYRLEKVSKSNEYIITDIIEGEYVISAISKFLSGEFPFYIVNDNKLYNRDHTLLTEVDTQFLYILDNFKVSYYDGNKILLEGKRLSYSAFIFIIPPMFLYLSKYCYNVESPCSIALNLGKLPDEFILNDQIIEKFKESKTVKELVSFLLNYAENGGF